MAHSEQSSSSSSKKLLIILAGGGLLLLLCCGGAFWFGKNMIGKVMITDPEAVRTRATAIADITIPEPYQPQVAMDMSAIGLPMTMCMFTRPDSQGGLMLMEMSGPMAGDQQQMKKQFQQGMQQQQNQNQQINVTSTETRTYLIEGEEYEFEFLTGTRPQDNVAVRQVMGVIPGKSGAAFLMLFETEENWDEEEISAMIESLGGELVETSDDTATEAPTPDEGTMPEAGSEAETPLSPGDVTSPSDSAPTEGQ